jgi:hypothetical protein
VTPRFILVGALLSQAACNYIPDSDERADENVVITARDEAANFTNYLTFALTPVGTAQVDVVGNITTGTLDGGAADALRAQLSSLMLMRGYRPVSPGEKADLGLGVGVFQGTRVAEVSNDYWGSYYGGAWGTSAAGIYYPFSFPYVYRTGVLALTLVDLGARAVPDAGLPALWTSVAYRVFPVGDPPSGERIGEVLQQAFQQSPYLHR